MTEYHDRPDRLTDLLARMDAIHEALTATRPEPAELLGRAEAAAFCDCGLSTWDKLTAAAETPPPVRLGGSPKWRRAELAAWIAHPKPNGELMGRAEWAAFYAQLRRPRRNGPPPG